MGREEIKIMLHGGYTMEQILPPRSQIIEKCKGCVKIVKENDNEFCKVYAYPDKKWRMCTCPTASHIILEVVKDKQRVGQQKQVKVKKKK